MRFINLRGNPENSPLRLVPSIAVVAGGFFGLVAALYAADKPGFQIKPIDEFANKQTAEGVTIAAEVYSTDDQAKSAFGKVNPWKYNILPVLVVVRNNSGHAVSLEKARFEYELPDRSRAIAIPAQDVKYSTGPDRPKSAQGPFGNVIVKKGKMPLDTPEIETRALSVKMLPAGETASGFVYFETNVASAGASLYISGLKDPASGKELYYFEIPTPSK